MGTKQQQWECPECGWTQKGKEKCAECGEAYRFDQTVHRADTATLIKEIADRFNISPGYLKARIPDYENKIFYRERDSTVSEEK